MPNDYQGSIMPSRQITGKISNASILPNGKMSNTILRGYSAYDVAVLNGFIGSESEWLASLKGETGEKGENGVNGRNGLDGRGITNVVLTTTSGSVDTYTIYYSDGTTSNFLLRNGVNGRNGEDGLDGRGISSITKTSSTNNTDTYTITYTDNTTSTYSVVNGVDGTNGQDGISVFVEVVTNTDSEYVLRFTNGTSTFTTPNLRAIADLTDYATKEWVEDKNYLTQHQDISGKANVSDLATVATTGSYNDLSNKPVIPTVPTNVSDFNNDVGYQTASDVSASISTALSSVLSYKGTVATVSALPSSNNKIGDVYHVTADGSEYAWNGSAWEELGSSVDLTGYATETWVNNQGYLTEHQDISGKANSADLATVATSGSYNDLTNKPTIPTVPTNISSFTNDAGYLTSHQSLTGYATEQWVGQQGYLTSYTETDPTVPAWAKASTKPSYTASEVGALPSTTAIPTKVSDLTNDVGYMTGLTFISYGISTWADFEEAYTKKQVVYCKASSNANPATGTQSRLAFLAYVNNVETPTEVEFQYYRSINSHSNNQQGDQVFVYKLTKTGGWTVTTREAASKVVAGTGLSSSYSSGAITLSLSSTIPTKTSDLTNDSGFLTAHQDITGKEDVSNKVTALSSSSTDTQYPSAKAVYDAIDAIPSGGGSGSPEIFVGSTTPSGYTLYIDPDGMIENGEGVSF